MTIRISKYSINLLYCELLIYLITSLSGCSKTKPDDVSTIRSSISDVYYTVETHYGHGAMDSDFARVYAHIEHNGKADKALVLSGEYLKISKIVWINPHENILYLDSGFTNIFRNRTTLSAGNVSETIYTHLQDHSNLSSAETPNN